jgi:lipopolysaccharide transport system ATP-binding protein
MSFDDVAIRVRNASKRYELYSTPRDRLKQFVLPRLQRLVSVEPRQYFREFWALHDVDFEIRRGETVGIVGRNGSGKSTLLQIICGTLAPTQGTIETNGRIAALLELGSGFNPDFTGRENVYLNGALLGLEKEEIDRCFDQIAAFADIGDFIDRSIKTYSSGMVVRLAFSVAVHSSPKILVVDEALSVGDELFQRKCFSRIAQIKQDGATILFVSHSGSTIIDLCDRAILLDSGEKLADGLPKAIVGQYQRLMYASPDKAPSIRHRIRHGGLDGLPHLVREAEEYALTEPRAPNPDEFYDPGLIPTSTIVYESRGALIESARITNDSGDLVNCLVSGRYYRYTFNVQFESGATNVLFGMLIKTISGVELGGGVTSSSLHQAIPYIAPNARLTVEFRFRCSLNPGVYFVNAGVVGTENGEETFLHRLLDACMFRVLPSPESLNSGLVDFSCTSEVLLMEGEEAPLS